MDPFQHPTLGAKLIADAHAELNSIDDLSVRSSILLAPYTRFGIGGPADLFAETAAPDAFVSAIQVCRRFNTPLYVLGDGSNVIISDTGFRGLVLRFTADEIRVQDCQIVADAGAPLEIAVTTSTNHGLQGLETLARIPGSVGAAIFGNAGAYGKSISDAVLSVEVFDGEKVCEMSKQDCDFVYRGSIFKQNKDWIIFQATLGLELGDRDRLCTRVAEITAIRDKKFPPDMRCAGSIFKNLHLADLPPNTAAEVPDRVVREGKVASAHFLEQVGAKGMRYGGIRIADYHANLIYNQGDGTSKELRELIADLKTRIKKRFGVDVQEEVQYVGKF